VIITLENFDRFFNIFLHCRKQKGFFTQVWTMPTSPKYRIYATLWKWNITFMKWNEMKWNVQLFKVRSKTDLEPAYCYNVLLEQHCPIKHGMKHKVHQVQRKQIDSHKVCSKCRPGKQIHVRFNFEPVLPQQKYCHSRAMCVVCRFP